ncbi:DJ-1/PfpI family protein [Bradyrhizobium canariense]|uniref:Glutamine amidotransferase n=1 Tax=Bradyrhizobium canariense TaxID=255045 RepID=A0A1X3G693_9BRAD|nr:DJ-1/PfpI family protein [Bradyrhizobium canariense]OSI78934.1 glutamine amidotransferase [Bradyrhizobium canariense]OSI82302.1 glutamine amidotransferase [Bradyrhizobium canariense]OSI96541.1 glutamine amidotransferase [Bradyrhizobium canariense]OSI97848.1 glutamine amidotransferase [Bradyrhizobium canariense]OSJ15407.1 glutamine amidotransferase [Bradyrhizobium canariense]
MAASVEIAILLYQGVTALDAVGPWEVLSRIPGAKVQFVGKEVGPVVAEGGELLLGATHSISETICPDVLVVPGGSTTPGQMVDDEVLDWLRKVHRTSVWTASVCTGALILGAAGILKGQPATTHGYKMGVLRIMGAKPRPDERVVRSGKVVTAAGVSAGIDLALWLAGEIAGRERAEAIQLVIEYDPHPPFDAGHISKASKEVQRLANKMMDDSMPGDQRRLVPKIAWNRFLDLVRTGQ